MAPLAEGHMGKHYWRRVFGLALLLAGGIFLFHAAVLVELARVLTEVHNSLIGKYGPENAGRILVPVCFLVLFVTHTIEASAWGLFLWRKGLMPTLTEAIYYAASSITALGYGDVVQRPPWRMLGPLVAINGLLMFGCSTAFLFLVLEKVWSQF